MITHLGKDDLKIYGVGSGQGLVSCPEHQTWSYRLGAGR